MISKRWLLVVILTGTFSLGSWYLYTNQPEENFSGTLLGAEESQLPVLPVDIADTSMRDVTLFIADPASGTLVRKVQAIDDGLSFLEQVAQTIRYLIQPDEETWNAAIPEGTTLLNVFVSQNSVAYLNLSRHLQDGHIGGLSAELTTVTSLVNTLLFNFQEIQQVQILVEGAEIETLAGHIDCRKPFSKMLLVDS